jgi:ketosteroid isomerase-like protein
LSTAIRIEPARHACKPFHLSAPMLAYRHRSHVASRKGVRATWTSELRRALRIRETRLVAAEDSGSPAAVIAAVAEAMNAHDINAFVALFAEDYDSQQPAHPDRAFRGSDQVRANWSEVFAGVPDFRAELVATAVEGDCVWSEWHWRGTHADGSRLDMAGVIIFGVQAERIAWARLYIEPVEQEGEGIEAAVRDMSARR